MLRFYWDNHKVAEVLFFAGFCKVWNPVFLFFALRYSLAPIYSICMNNI